jgi:hypothetical protein
MRGWRLIRVISVLLLFACATARAWGADNAPQLLIRAHLEPSGPVVAGSQIKLVVDCLTTTWFTEAPDWPLFTVPGAIVSLPDEQAQNLHEVIEGVDWFGVSRAYRIVPQTGRAFVIPSFAITVQPGQMSVPVKLMTPVLNFTATVPPGAEGMSTFFPAQKLVATQRVEPSPQHVEPSPQHVRVGDEVTRTITQRAAGTQSMLIPPVDFADVTGLKRYPKAAATRDIVEDRAGLVAGERTDTVTYVVDHGGKFTLPAVTIEWWNTAAQRKETIVLPPVAISAVAATEKPLFAIPVDALSKGAAHRIVVIDRTQVFLFGLLLVAVLALIWAYPRCLAFYRRVQRETVAARQRYADGPVPAWRALQSATRNGSLPRVIPALYRWMDRNAEFGHPARLDALDPAAEGLEPLAKAIKAHYEAGQSASFERKATEAALHRAVKQARKKRKGTSPLPPLNLY